MLRLVLVFLILAISNLALANGSVSGKVVAVRVDQNGIGMVTFDQPVTGAPASCRHPAYANALSFDSNTAGGRTIAAAALAAKATGDTVSAYGTGACTIYGGAWVEDWSYGVVQ